VVELISLDGIDNDYCGIYIEFFRIKMVYTAVYARTSSQGYMLKKNADRPVFKIYMSQARLIHVSGLGLSVNITFLQFDHRIIFNKELIHLLIVFPPPVWQHDFKPIDLE